MIKHSTQTAQQAPESFALMFERAPGGFKIQLAIVGPDGKRQVLRPRGPAVCTQLTAVSEADAFGERIEDWLAGKFVAGDDQTLEAAK